MIMYSKLLSSRSRHQYGIFGGESQTSYTRKRHSGRERRRTAVFAGYLTAGMLPYKHLFRPLEIFSACTVPHRTALHSTAPLYNAAASPATRLRSAGSLAINLARQNMLSMLFLHYGWQNCLFEITLSTSMQFFSVVAGTSSQRKI